MENLKATKILPKLGWFTTQGYIAVGIVAVFRNALRVGVTLRPVACIKYQELKLLAYVKRNKL